MVGTCGKRTRDHGLVHIVKQKVGPGTATDKGVHVPHDLTQEELAQLVGASRETVNKSLADFVSRGWIRLEGRAVTLLDVDRLARRAR